MTWPLAFVLVAAMLIIFAGIREWRRIQVAEAEVRKAQAYTTAALSNNMRAASERMAHQLERIERMRGAGHPELWTTPSSTPSTDFTGAQQAPENIIPFGKKKPGDDGDAA